MMLVAGRILTLFDEAPGGVRAGHVLDEESPEPLAWRVEAGTVIQPANEHQEFVERDGHGTMVTNLDASRVGAVATAPASAPSFPSVSDGRRIVRW
jgi:hypothetical protein